MALDVEDTSDIVSLPSLDDDDDDTFMVSLNDGCSWELTAAAPDSFDLTELNALLVIPLDSKDHLLLGFSAFSAGAYVYSGRLKGKSVKSLIHLEQTKWNRFFCKKDKELSNFVLSGSKWPP